MQTPEEKKAEEERKAKEAAEAAEKAEGEKKTAAKKEAAKKAFYDVLAKDLQEPENTIVEVPVPMTQEEIVHMPNIIYHEYMEIIMQEQEQIKPMNIILELLTKPVKLQSKKTAL